MDKLDIDKIEKIIADRKKAYKFFATASTVFNSFLEMEKLTYAEGNISTKNKQLIALGISIYANCESCMECHIKEALNAGATRDEIIEAIGVAIEMGGGPATVASRFAMNVLEYYFNK
ncbi:MAG: carboxymuconolactone decarboxylase family protein [Thermoguttaceae bacterium]|jgi:AhpD family alkylhydroperoxidase